MDLVVNGMGLLKMRLVDSQLDGEGRTHKYKQVQVFGKIPVTKKTRVGFVTSVLDNTTDEKLPVFSFLDSFQENRTIAYQHVSEVGVVSPEQGFVEWVKVGVVLNEILQAPFKGKRKLTVIVRLIDMDNPPNINRGLHDEDGGPLLWISGTHFEQEFLDKGYLEEVADREESQALSIKIGVAVAMADGSLADSEGEVIKAWIEKLISAVRNKDRLKTLYNDAFKEAYSEALKGTLSLSDLTSRLGKIGEKKTKYDAIELCFDVMTADSEISPEEMRTVENVANALELDLEEIKRIRDQRIVKMTGTDGSQVHLLGIQSDWTPEQVRRHLRDEFQKWNNRLNTLPEGPERQNAQKMLDIIAEERKKSA